MHSKYCFMYRNTEYKPLGCSNSLNSSQFEARCSVSLLFVIKVEISIPVKKSIEKFNNYKIIFNQVFHYMESTKYKPFVVEGSFSSYSLYSSKFAAH